MTCVEQNLLRNKEIEDDFMSLMQELPYAQIAVNNLPERMKLARKSPCHYFHSKHTRGDPL